MPPKKRTTKTCDVCAQRAQALTLLMEERERLVTTQMPVGPFDLSPIAKAIARGQVALLDELITTLS